MSQTVPVLTPAFPQKVAEAKGRTLSPLKFVLGRFLIFDDGHNLYAYSRSLERSWAIVARSKLWGWAVQASEIYVQDGPVLCQYGITEMSSDIQPVPGNAVNLITATNWTAQPPSDQSALTALFAATTLTGGPPAVWSSGLSTPAVAGLLSDGKMWALPANLVTGNATATGVGAGASVEIFVEPQGDKAHLRYMSGGKAMSYLASDLDHAIIAESGLPPTTGEPHWRAMHRLAAARRGRPSQDCVTLAPLNSTPIVAVAPLPADDWLIVFQGKDLVRCSRSGSTLMATLTNLPMGPPVRFTNSAGEWLYTLTTDPNGDVYLEQYKLASTSQGTSNNAWPLIASQLAGVGPWIEGALPPPFDENSTVVCYAAALDALGKTDSGIAGRLSTVVPAAADPMITIAASCSLVDETTRALLRLAPIPRDTLLAILARVKHPPEKIGPIMRDFYDLDGKEGEWLTSAMLAKDFILAQVASAMFAGRYPVCPFITQAGLPLQVSSWVHYTGTEIAVTQKAKEIAIAIQAAGNRSADVAVSCKDLDIAHIPAHPEAGSNHRIWIATSIFRAGYPLMTGVDALRDLTFAGHDPKPSAVACAVLFNGDLSQLDPRMLDPNQPNPLG
jgi:hypothetical protein